MLVHMLVDPCHSCRLCTRSHSCAESHTPPPTTTIIRTCILAIYILRLPSPYPDGQTQALLLMRPTSTFIETELLPLLRLVLPSYALTYIGPHDQCHGFGTTTSHDLHPSSPTCRYALDTHHGTNYHHTHSGHVPHISRRYPQEAGSS